MVTGGDPVELAGDGVFIDHDARYEVTDEFLRVWRALLAGAAGGFRGEHSAGGRQATLPAGAEAASAAVVRRLVDAGHEIAAEHIDTYLTWGEPPAGGGREARRVGPSPAAGGSFGIRLHVIVRETEAEAWAGADV